MQAIKYYAYIQSCGSGVSTLPRNCNSIKVYYKRNFVIEKTDVTAHLSFCYGFLMANSLYILYTIFEKFQLFF